MVYDEDPLDTNIDNKVSGVQKSQGSMTKVVGNAMDMIKQTHGCLLFFIF